MFDPNAYGFGPKIGPKSDPNCVRNRKNQVNVRVRMSLVADDVRSGVYTNRPSLFYSPSYSCHSHSIFTGHWQLFPDHSSGSQHEWTFETHIEGQLGVKPCFRPEGVASRTERY